MIIHMVDYLARKCARLKAAGPARFLDFIRTERRMLILQIRAVLQEYRVQALAIDLI